MMSLCHDVMGRFPAVLGGGHVEATEVVGTQVHPEENMTKGLSLYHTK